MYVSDLQAMLGIRRVQRDYSNENLDYLDDQGGGGGGFAAQNASAWTLQTIACGDSHTAALTGSGAVWIWGSNEDGQLGLGEEVEEVAERSFFFFFFTPAEVLCSRQLYTRLPAAVCTRGTNE